MTDDTLDARLRAVERHFADDGDDDSATPDDDSQTPLVPADRLDDVDARLEAAERRLDALDAGVQSVRGYVGALEHVNEEVERRADAALAVAERLEDERPGRDPLARTATATDEPDAPDAIGAPDSRAPSPADREFDDEDRRGPLDHLLDLVRGR